VVHLARQKRYPAEAKRLALQGTAMVAFTVEPGGGVSNIRLVKSSGSSILDDEVQSMVLRAHPFPSPPDGQAQRFNAPVQFKLSGPRPRHHRRAAR
jgi:protein TonB